MGTAREVASKYPSQILDIAYRKRQLGFRRTQISQWLENETELLKEEVIRKTQASEVLGDDYVSERLAAIEGEAKRQETEALGTFGMLAGDDPTISPLRRALAVWGLTIDDVGVASVRFPLPRSLLTVAPVPWHVDSRERQERVQRVQRAVPSSRPHGWQRAPRHLPEVSHRTPEGFVTLSRVDGLLTRPRWCCCVDA